MGAGHPNTTHMAIYSLHTRNSTQHCRTEGWEGGGGSRPRWKHSTAQRLQGASHTPTRAAGSVVHTSAGTWHTETENARNGGTEGGNRGVAVAVGHSTDTTQTWHGRGGARHPSGAHARRRGGGGAPQGHGAGRGSAAGNVTHTHVSVHGTRHQHCNVCVRGGGWGGHSFCRTGHGVVETPNKHHAMGNSKAR